MNQNAIIGIVVAVAVVGGGAWYFSTHQSAGTPITDTADSGTTTLVALMALGGSKQCQVTVTTPDSPAMGTVYVSGTDVRSDVVAKPSTMGGKEVTAHMIKSGDYIYSWTDMIPQGVKIKIDAAEQSSAKSPAGYDANAQVQYACSAWVADPSKFVVPSNVTFMDFSAGASGMMPIKGGTMPTPPPGTPNTY